MLLSVDQINMGGLSIDVIKSYQSKPKVKRMIEDIRNGDIMPPILVYPSSTSIYTIADGIHRLSSYLFLGIKTFETNFYQ